ncbi:hypothetical protein P0Y35_08965 [Kiritimatiellaeota bacterium B1221]|nr:hypothetical protein [Kiritimatiellaeota bacterium B1221]
MKKFCLLCLFLPLFSVSAMDPGDLEFMEAFAWGDRQSALKELVPDTEDYYYYHCLHYQLINDRVAFQKTLDAWAQKNNRSWNHRMHEMQRRQKLIEFDTRPAETWQYLQQHISFNHRPRNETRTPNYPSVLNPDQYTIEDFISQAKRHNGLLNDVTPRGLEVALSHDKDPDHRRAFLGQLQRPDIPGLVDLILADLKYKNNSRGFGLHQIHSLLTLAQLEELAQREPDLLRSENYVTQRLSRIQPPEVDLSHDHRAAIDYYQQLWSFVQTLGSTHNSLKASTLYRLLDHQRQTGVYDEDLFKNYLAFPRQVYYLSGKQRDTWNRQRADWVNFAYRPAGSIILPPIGQEEPLVKDFLLTFLKTAPNPSAYHQYFTEEWLNAIFAESKILAGAGKPADWAHLLNTDAYRRILERIELNFAPENPAYVKPGQEVNLQVDVKRVDSLLVKIYELQTFNYYQTHRAPVDQAIDLDGMIPTHERTLEVKADPGRRIRRTLTLPEIQQRGVYVVELIGNGVSSRALLHVGHLESISVPTAAGQVMVVLNEQGETVEDAKVWMDGREYSAGKGGMILLPYSENPGTRFVILQDGNFASPENFSHLGEDYQFTAGIHIDPQTLNRRSTGNMILRPDFRIQGFPLDPALLKDVTVTLASTDAQGTRSEREFSAEFVMNREWAREFYVPEGLRQLDVAVTAKIKRKSDLEEITLTDSYSLQVNGARSGNTLHQVFLVPSAKGWSLEVRGLNGEPITDLPLRVYVYHPAFKADLDFRLTTDENGKVQLGSLSGLNRIQVTGDNIHLDLPLEGGQSVYPQQIHMQAGEIISLPYPFERKPDLQAASLLKKGKGELNLLDLGRTIQIANGELTIEGLTPGEYELALHETGRNIRIRVEEGKNARGFILGGSRRLQTTDVQFPSIAKVEADKKNLNLQLRNLKQGTRVAVRAYRYEGFGQGLGGGFGYPNASNRTVYPPHTQYISGRNIGDEYRYVLERKFQKVFAGTLLERPGLILNPWMLRETEADLEELNADQAYRGGRQRMNAPASASDEMADGFGYVNSNRKQVYRGGAGGGAKPDIGFDFLPNGSIWWVNLVPEKDGSLSVPLKGLDEHSALEIVVLDRFGSTVIRTPLIDTGFKPAEVRLVDGLDPEKNFSRQKTVRKIDPATPIVFPDLTTTRYQVIGDFATAFDLLQTLNGDARLQKFSFLKDWPQLDDKTKREKYGAFASHELHLFLYERDPAFFTAVVKPYLQNKKDKTFVDRWLLDELLPEDSRIDTIQKRNALELALLARRGGDTAAMQAALREAWELLPPDPDAFANRVRVALQANELEETESLARDKVKKSVGEFKDGGAARSGGRIMSSSLSTADPFGAAAPPPAASAPRMEKAGLGMAQADAEVVMDIVDAPKEQNLMGLTGGMRFFDDEELPARLYRALPKTKEWAEQNYYELRIEQDVAGHIPVNQFWRDVAAGEKVSPHLLEANRNLNEVLTALAFCGLPFEADKPVEEVEGAQLSLKTSAPAILVSEQILPAEKSKDERPLLISQQFFRPDDMYRFEDNERIEKFISGEFIRRSVYGARVTLTNPTASRRRLNVLMQIPRGAIPLRNGFYTDDKSILLQPYTTQTAEYFFTFPESGTFHQFPAHAADKEAIIGKAEARVFEVKDAPTEVDKTSWAWVSQYASPEETLAFLQENNLRRLNLDDTAWRLKDKNFFHQTVSLLEERGLFHDTTYSYGIYHKDIPVTRIWLANSTYAKQVGPVLDSPLLTVNPVETKSYQHLEYDPLVNPRAHDLGDKREILNQALNQQYRSFLHHNLYRNKLDAQEQLALVYYLQLQDRLEEAFQQMAKIDENQVPEKIQFAYLQAWMALRNLEVDKALAIAQPYQQHPVPRWQSRFDALVKAIDEARGADAAEVEDPNRQQDLNQLAAREPSIELETVSGTLQLTAHHLNEVTLNLYPMDIELLFSRKPFLAEGGADFAVIKPALTRTVNIQGNGEAEALQLPEEYRDQNLMVELTGKGKQASVAWYANQLKVRKMENYGQVEVRASDNHQVLPKTYIKVFALSVDGKVSFWKDGYTDLRGRFDYLSLNNRKPEEAAEFSILILHPDHGAEIIKAEPPVR